MNVTELARRIKVSPNELLDMLPGLGFDIGRRAIKIDDRTAWRIIEQWPQLKREWEKKHGAPEKIEEVEEIKNVKKEVRLPAVLTVRDFAAALGLPVNKVIGELMKNSILVAMNERLDFTTASIIAQDLGFEIKEAVQSSAEQKLQPGEQEETKDIIKESIGRESSENMLPRPPVIVVMGHVDHGKSRLLETIRKVEMLSKEAGGITQHIGAYQTTKKGRLITFIDTPGHEAFTTMRSRGARVADIAILTVAADDGVQPQTIEALKIIAAANLPFVVAVNKMDKSGADAERVKRELSEKGVLPEDWGGKVPFVPISAKQGTGIDTLLDIILLVADLNKDTIVANPNARAIGTVIESHVDPGEGPVATMLIQNGTLRGADTLIIGNVLYGKVRAIKNWAGRIIKSAPPGMPVKILGFKVAPEVGDIIQVPESSAKKTFIEKARPIYKAGARTSSTAPEPPESQVFINTIIKTDTLGSLEAICAELEQLRTPEVAVKTISKGLGNITEVDILQAESSKAIVYGFQVSALPPVQDLARDKEVKIQTYKIIYELLDDIKARLQILLKPEIIHTDLGTLKVLAVFRKEKNYVIIGGRVENGKAVKNAKIKIIRASVEQGEGVITELQSAKQSVDEAPGGSECGMKITTKNPIEAGDVLRIYKEDKKERKLIV